MSISPSMNLKAKLSDAIADPRGWDILFFAGHSDDEFGGELMLSPDTSALIDEFADVLKLARDRGLKFAFFNSCRGCAIAEELIGYGLGHVVVMRERISNKVAQIFFQEFAQQLANYVDVQTATIRACEMLFHLAKERYEYPSAFLVPSIYAYGGVDPLTVPALNWRVMLSRLKPTKREAIVLLALVFLSCQMTVQYPLIDGRQVVQATYRDLGELIQTQVRGPSIPNPPILLVKLDDASLNAAKIESKNPIDRSYIAQLVQKAIDLNVPTIGIDYVLKDYRREQPILQKTLANPQGSRFVFAAAQRWGTAHEDLIRSDDRVDGDIDLNDSSRTMGRDRAPIFFARTIGDPSKTSAYPFPHQLLCITQHQTKNCKIADSRAYYNPMTALSTWVGQQWLNPWIDYSIPVQQVYEIQRAQDFLQRSQKTPKIVILIPSEEDSFDPYPIPKAIVSHLPIDPPPESIAGGEIHGYALYNLLNQGLIIPIPDCWAIAIVAVLSKLILLWIQSLPKKQSISKWGWLTLFGILPIMAYGLILQVYNLLGVMLPLLFPTLIYFSYLLPQWFRQRLQKPINHRIDKAPSAFT